MVKKVRIGLALSGGGFRAAAFHLGVLRKLNDLDILSKIDVISTISGGSITGAYYVLNKDNFNLFEESFQKKLQQNCIKKIILHWRFLTPIILIFTSLLLIISNPFSIHLPRWSIFIILLAIITIVIIFQFKILSFSHLKIRAYKKIFFNDATISDLPTSPILAINATNLSTGTLWTFSRNKCSDSSYEYPKDGGNSIYFDCSKMPIALAVASSTSVPVPFDPIEISKKYFKNIEDTKRAQPKLMDGGLYDNQGIHKLTQENSSYTCDIIIVSDGSQPFSYLFKTNNTLFILYRGIDVMMRKIKSLQFIRDIYSSKREIAYFSLDWKYKQCITEFVKAAKNGLVFKAVLDYHQLTEEVLQLDNNVLVENLSNKINYKHMTSFGLTDEEIRTISLIKTNLTALSNTQINLLSRHGQVLTELQLKLYCPTLNN